jgi:DNA topoisomerase-2
MYVGSVSAEVTERFILGEWKKAQYVPALSKMVDEIIDNSIDEAIRTNFKHANKIDVTVKDGEITVTDNGRGIPQEKIIDAQTNSEILRPVAAWTRVNAGTSFDDERVTIGANGVGSACTNFLSTKFVGKTWQKGNLIEVHCTDGGLNVDVKEKSKVGNGTSVSFTPDLSLMEVDSIEEFDTVALIEDRLTSLQLAFPEIRFSFNGNKIPVSALKSYAALFAHKDATVVMSQNANVSCFFTGSDDGFRANSFVNGVNTRQGGSYVDFVVNAVVEELTAMIKRKHKIDVAKNTLKGGLTFVLFARKFTNPKFDSQTKERLTSTAGSVKQHYEESGAMDAKLIAKKIMAADDIINPIIEAQISKKQADESRQAALEQKKLKKVKVAKHIAASSDEATLFIVEGDSAASSFLEVRDPVMTGAYPLRGVIMNTWDMKPSDVLKNKELSELVAILGLDINNKNSVSQMQYAKIAIMCDQDHDGAGHIAPLLVAFFYRFWPRLIDEGRVNITRSPIMISSKLKDVKWFYTYEDAQAFKTESVGYKHRYIKGLGSLETSEYHKIVNEPVFDNIKVDDPVYLEMMFGKSPAPRKEFMTK